MIDSKDIARFEKYFIKNDGCWLWIGTKNTQGYGDFRCNKKRYGSHRFSYIVYKGEIPKGIFVLHSCDNPACVNPDHLWLGTAKDNSIDMYSKNRHPFTEEIKLKISLLKKNNKNMLGKKHSEEKKKKMRIAGKGKKHSEEHNRKMGLIKIGNKNMLGKIFSEEHRRKIGLIHKGKIESEETRKKKSASAKIRCEREKQLKLEKNKCP